MTTRSGKGVEIPEELAQLLARPEHAAADEYFESVAPSHQRAYVEYVTDAESSEARDRRAARTLEALLQRAEQA